MKRQLQGALLSLAFIAAFITCVVLHSLIGSVIVLLSAVTVSYVVAISWMRTAPDQAARRKQTSLP